MPGERGLLECWGEEQQAQQASRGARCSEHRPQLHPQQRYFFAVTQISISAFTGAFPDASS